MTDRPSPLVSAEQLHFDWSPGETALCGIDFTVERGETVGLLGSNGAGKTTLLYALTGQLRPDRGAVRLFGLDPVTEGVAVRRRLGFVAEADPFPPHMTVGALFRLHRDLFADWDGELFERLCARFPLPANKPAGSLSKGQARQAALVCALAHRPELLLLDEPASGLDPAMRREFLEAALEVATDETATVFSSHHVQDVERLATRIVVLDRGRVLLDAPADALHDRFCVAQGPGGRGDHVERELARDPRFVRARRRNGELHAVLAGEPESLDPWLRELGWKDARCRRVPLEDLFVELVGRDG